MEDDVSVEVATQARATRGRLDSWKEVAAYLKVSERSVRRWEALEGLPVHRHYHRKRGTIHAYRDEIDDWWAQRSARSATVHLERSEAAEGGRAARHWRARIVSIAMATLLAMVAWGGGTVLWRAGEMERREARAAPMASTPASWSRLPVHDAYLRGAYLMDHASRQGLARAVEAFHQAIDADPTHAPAYVGLADATNRSVIYGVLSGRRAYPTIAAALTRALALAPDLSDAHAVRGAMRFRYEWDWHGAELDFQHALRLSPDSVRARLGYSTLLLARGQLAEAARMARHNVLADPLSPQFLLDFAWKQRYAGDVKGAMTSLARALAMNPDQPQALSERAAMRVTAGDTAGAIDDCERVLAADAEHQAALATCAHVFAGAGRRDRAGAVLALLTGNATAAPDPYQVAVTHHALGRTRAAVASLEDALASRSANLCLLGVDLRAGRLPITPESLALLSRIGLRPDAFGLADP